MDSENEKILLNEFIRSASYAERLVLTDRIEKRCGVSRYLARKWANETNVKIPALAMREILKIISEPIYSQSAMA